MTIKIVVAPIVSFDVKGAVLDESGQEQAFDFRLKARRLNAEELERRFAPESKEKLTDLIADLVQSWEGVLSESGELVPYSADRLHELFRQYPGLPQMIIESYLDGTRVKRKN